MKVFSLRLPEDLFDVLVLDAELKRRSANSQIVYILEQHYYDQGLEQDLSETEDDNVPQR